MFEHGVYLAPSEFEACFTSTAHDSGIIGRTIEAGHSVFKTLPLRNTVFQGLCWRRGARGMAANTSAEDVLWILVQLS
jgi:hypothetical protein